MNLTNAVWSLVIVGLLVYDIWAAFVNRTPKDTLSEAVWKASVNRPIIPFLAGLVCGHLFWTQTCP